MSAKRCPRCETSPGWPHAEGCPLRKTKIDPLRLPCPLASCDAAAGQPCKNRHNHGIHMIREALALAFEAARGGTPR